MRTRLWTNEGCALSNSECFFHEWFGCSINLSNDIPFAPVGRSSSYLRANVRKYRTRLFSLERTVCSVAHRMPLLWKWLVLLLHQKRNICFSVVCESVLPHVFLSRTKRRLRGGVWAALVRSDGPTRKPTPKRQAVRAPEKIALERPMVVEKIEAWGEALGIEGMFRTDWFVRVNNAPHKSTSVEANPLALELPLLVYCTIAQVFKTAL